MDGARMDGTPKLKGWMRAARLARRLGVTPATVRGWIRAGRVEGVKCAGRWLVRKEAARALLERPAAGGPVVAPSAGRPAPLTRWERAVLERAGI